MRYYHISTCFQDLGSYGKNPWPFHEIFKMMEQVAQWKLSFFEISSYDIFNRLWQARYLVRAFRIQVVQMSKWLKQPCTTSITDCIALRLFCAILMARWVFNCWYTGPVPTTLNIGPVDFSFQSNQFTYTNLFCKMKVNRLDSDSISSSVLNSNPVTTEATIWLANLLF